MSLFAVPIQTQELGWLNYRSDQYLSVTDLPNSTTAYIYRAQNGNNIWLAVNGGPALTTNGTLGSAVDHLGNITQNNFNGTQYVIASSNAIPASNTLSFSITLKNSNYYLGTQK